MKVSRFFFSTSLDQASKRLVFHVFCKNKDNPTKTIHSLSFSFSFLLEAGSSLPFFSFLSPCVFSSKVLILLNKFLSSLSSDFSSTFSFSFFLSFFFFFEEDERSRSGEREFDLRDDFRLGEVERDLDLDLDFLFRRRGDREGDLVGDLLLRRLSRDRLLLLRRRLGDLVLDLERRRDERPMLRDLLLLGDLLRGDLRRGERVLL